VKKQIWLGVFLLLFSNPSSSTQVNPSTLYIGKTPIKTIGITWGNSSQEITPQNVTMEPPISDNKYTSFDMSETNDANSTKEYKTAINKMIDSELGALSNIDNKKINKISSAAKDFVNLFLPRDDKTIGFFAVIFHDDHDIGIYAMWIHDPWAGWPMLHRTLSLGVDATSTLLSSTAGYTAQIQFKEMQNANT